MFYGFPAIPIFIESCEFCRFAGMKFEVGDTVLLLHSGEEGAVVEILNHEMVSVDVHGVVFPVYTDQLDFPYFKRFTESRSKKAKPKVHGETLPVEKQRPVSREESGMFLTFLPVYDLSTDEFIIQALKIHLMNETSLSYQFRYNLFLNGELHLDIKNTSFPFSHFYLNDLPFDELNDRPRFDLTFSLSSPDPHRADEYKSTLKLKAKQVIRKIQGLQEKRHATFSYRLFEKYPKKNDLQKTTWDFPAPSQKIKYVNTTDPGVTMTPHYEVDLHIENLFENPAKLTPTEMLDIQLAELHRMLELAIANRQFSMVVIHGVGKGTLRNEVHEVLQHTPEVKSFVNQYDIRYGYGATEIFFEYK